VLGFISRSSTASKYSEVKVTAPEEPPPDIPSPAVTEVISPVGRLSIVFANDALVAVKEPDISDASWLLLDTIFDGNCCDDEIIPLDNVKLVSADPSPTNDPLKAEADTALLNVACPVSLSSVSLVVPWGACSCKSSSYEATIPSSTNILLLKKNFERSVLKCEYEVLFGPTLTYPCCVVILSCPLLSYCVNLVLLSTSCIALAVTGPVKSIDPVN